jgi:hypothetical protein
MFLRTAVLAAWLLAITGLGLLPAQAMVAPVADPLCAEETVYGTVVILDEQHGVFGLLGTRYKFQSMEEVNLEFLQGRMVKIDIGPDCGIEDIRVLDGTSESIT